MIAINKKENKLKSSIELDRDEIFKNKNCVM